jgi:hypothetical protein
MAIEDHLGERLFQNKWQINLSICGPDRTTDDKNGSTLLGNNQNLSPLF